MDLEKEKQILVQLLQTKTALKQDVFANSKKWFKVFKKELKECVEIMKKDITDDRVRLKYVDKGEGEAHLFVGSDVLVFYLHSNVFKFSSKDYNSQTSYIQKNPANAYCGIVHIYDFLADSYEFNRPNDLGYLIGRVFINSEDHFVVEGKGQLDFLYRNFMQQVISADYIRDIILRSAIHALDFDLLTPPYQNVQQVSVFDMQTLSQSSKMKTGKRLGFKFQANTKVGD